MATSTQQDNRVSILALGLNPAWQKVLRFECFKYGEVNRAREMLEFPAGKGANFAKAAHAAGGECTVAQFLGGTTGEDINSALEERGIGQITVEVAAHTRVCTTLISDADGATTEIIEPSGEISEAEVQALHGRIIDNLPRFEAVALCGTFPPGVPPTFYADVIRAARRRNMFVLLDCYRDVGLALEAGPVVLKINKNELTALTERSGDRNPIGEGQGAGQGKTLHCESEPENVVSQARYLLARYPIAAVAVTAGPDEAWLVTADRQSRLEPPKIDNPVNPIGAGDCAAGVFVVRCLEKMHSAGTEDPQELDFEAMSQAFSEALSAASRSCRHLEPAVCE